MQPFLHGVPILGLTLLFFSLASALSLTNAPQLSAPLSLTPLSPQEATDTVTIEQVLNAFAVALDQRRFEAFKHIFTADVTVNLNLQGVPVIRNLNDFTAFLGRALQGTVTFSAQSTHYVQFVDPARAYATTYTSVTSITTRGRQTQTITKLGRYKDVVVKRAGGWLISERILFPVSTTNAVLALPEDNSTATFF